MSMIKGLVLGGVAVAVLSSPNGLDTIKDTAANLFAPAAEASTEKKQTYARVCALAKVWADTDEAGRQTTAKIMRGIARTELPDTSDPALRAFLKAVPHAFSDQNSARSRAARMLIDHGCANRRG